MRVDPVDKGRKDNTVGASTPDSIPWMAPAGGRKGGDPTLLVRAGREALAPIAADRGAPVPIRSCRPGMLGRPTVAPARCPHWGPTEG
jgi:hypothetical protein